MKKKIIIAIAVIAANSFTNILSAQNPSTATETEGQKVKTKSNIKNDRMINNGTVACVINMISTPKGCDIIFKTGDKPVTQVSADPHVENMPGKTKSNSFIFSIDSSDNSVTEVKNPRDMSTGMPAGKTSYSDLSVMINLEKASVGKSKPEKIEEENGEFILSGLTDGDHDITCQWNWGATGATDGATGKTGLCSASFILTIEGGICTRMAINTKGTGANNDTEEKRKKSSN